MNTLTGVTALIVLLAGAAEARPLLCAMTTVLECDETATCTRRTAESAALPTFVLVDTEQRTVSAVGSNARAPIMSSTQHDGRLIVHGGEAGRGWSATITETTGKMAVAVVDDDVTFSIFGMCVRSPGAMLP